MLRILGCIQNDHDRALLLLAALLSIVSCVAAVVLLRKARESDTSAARLWLVVAGLSTGFGVWATHFVAMLAYRSELILGYAPGLTFLSLLLVAISTTAGFAIALGGGRVRPLAGGAVVGAGIGVMHYTGMAAIQLHGVLLWSAPLVAVSVVAGVGLAALALKRTMRAGARLRDAAAGAVLLSSAVLAHHFIGMGALTLLPTLGDPISGMLLSPNALGVSIAVSAASILMLATGTAMISSRAEIAKRRSEREFRILVEGITDSAIYMLDRGGRITSWNAGAQQLTGYASEEAIGRPFWDMQPPAALGADGGRALLARASAEGKTTRLGWGYRKDGSRFRAHVTLERLLGPDGELLGFAKFTRDVTRQHEDEAKLTRLAGDLDAALSNMHHGLCMFDAEQRLVLANRRVAEMFGLPPEACPAGTPFIDTLRTVLDRRPGPALTEEQLKQIHDKHLDCIRQPGGGSLIVDFSEDCVLSIVHRPMPDGSWVSTYEDVTDRRRSEARIAYMAMHDGLTGLPNRAHLNDRLDEELARAAGSDGKVAVMAIDLSRFTEINDSHGHNAGDAVLRTLADRFQATAHEDERIARVGGDEFAAIKPFTDERDLADFVRRLKLCFAEPIAHDRIAIKTGASIGIALHPQDGATREQLLNNAALAMQRGKGTAGVQTCYFETGMDEAHRTQRALAQDVGRALADGQFHLVYQVQRTVDTDAVVGYEALIRWNHPVRGNIPPMEFIPMAEESGAILDIGRWVLRTACREAARWAEPHRIAVNLSPVQLGDPAIVATVANALASSGLAPERLELEITESTIISDKARGLHTLRQIRALGVSIAIDDFGTGYSSLDTLNSFPFDKIKIDRSFLSSSAANSQSLAIIRAVLALGRSLGMPVLAEGVETQAQLDLLRAEGCEQAQGYLLGRPEPRSADIALKAAA